MPSEQEEKEEKAKASLNPPCVQQLQNLCILGIPGTGM